MNKKELIKALENLPDDMRIWLGVDGGEGYLPLEEVFQANTVGLPLDLDCASEKELIYFDDDKQFQEIFDEAIANGKDFMVDGDCVNFDVIVLGINGARQDYYSSIDHFMNQDEIQIQTTEKELAELKAAYEAKERELRALKAPQNENDSNLPDLRK